MVILFRRLAEPKIAIQADRRRGFESLTTPAHLTRCGGFLLGSRSVAVLGTEGKQAKRLRERAGELCMAS